MDACERVGSKGRAVAFSGRRGVAVVETAFTIAFTLLVIYATLEIGIVNYLQVQADGAAFIAAHQVQIGGADGALTASGVFARIPQNAITTKLQPSPNAAENPLDFNYTNAQQRSGGSGGVQGEVVEAVASIPEIFRIPFIGVSVGVRGQNQQFTSYEYNQNGNLAGNQTFADQHLNATAYARSADNVPPAFIYVAGLNTCVRNDFGSWNAANPPAVGECPLRDNGDIRNGLGEAARLNQVNWNRPFNGVAHKGQSAFFEMVCHQNTYVRWLQKAMAFSHESLPTATDPNFQPMNYFADDKYDVTPVPAGASPEYNQEMQWDQSEETGGQDYKPDWGC